MLRTLPLVARRQSDSFQGAWRADSAAIGLLPLLWRARLFDTLTMSGSTGFGEAQACMIVVHTMRVGVGRNGFAQTQPLDVCSAPDAARRANVASRRKRMGVLPRLASVGHVVVMC